MKILLIDFVHRLERSYVSSLRSEIGPFDSPCGIARMARGTRLTGLAATALGAETRAVVGLLHTLGECPCNMMESLG